MVVMGVLRARASLQEEGPTDPGGTSHELIDEKDLPDRCQLDDWELFESQHGRGHHDNSFFSSFSIKRGGTQDWAVNPRASTRGVVLKKSSK